MGETGIKKNAEVYSPVIKGLNFCETIIDKYEINKIGKTSY